MTDYSDKNSVNRRSFLGRVAGGAVAVGGSMTAVVHAARAQANYTGVTDCDTTAGSRDRPGYGRGVRNQHTDSDGGPTRDAACQGRGTTSGSPTGTQYPGRTPTGCSDSDQGSQGDPSGYGRACRGQAPNPYATQPSGCSDRDPTDPYGDGRNCAPQR
jgi:hypothetical protein